jgi:DNA-binding NarL/FixJ family response regulator
VRIYVLDQHAIYRRGMAACLEALEGVEGVGHAGSVGEADADPALGRADVVIVDPSIDGGFDFIASVARDAPTKVVACASGGSDDTVLAAIGAGAVGFLRKDTLTTAGLASAVRAAYDGAGVLAPDLLGLMRGQPRDNGASLINARLTDREQRVLALIADGHQTREVAERLCYSERTVKNVLHEVAVKLNARSRSQAVAHAVREGLI